MSDIFISYASQDRSRVRPLADALSGYGWSVWWDLRIPTGGTFDQVIPEALAGARCVVVVWSRHAVASTWVREEADVGRKRGVLIPVLIDDVTPPFGFGRIQAAAMTEWDGRSESDAFQRLAADIARVIGAPPHRAPTTPDHQAGASQPVIPTRKTRAAPRIVSHRRGMKLVLTAAPALALLVALVDYATDRGGGDSAPPPPARAPAETSGLQLAAVLAEGGEPLARGVSFNVFTAAQDVAGRRKHITGSRHQYAAAWFPLPVGRYFITAAYGNASASMDVEVTRAGVTRQILNLRAGFLRLSAVLAERTEALTGAAYEVYTAVADVEGNRKRVTGSHHQDEASTRFLLPAGRYFVTAAYGSASANVEAEVAPGGNTQEILNLRAGILRLPEVLAAGGEPLERGVAYEVYTAVRDAEGNRKRVTGTNQSSGSARFTLPSGRYFVTAAHDHGNASAEIAIAAGRTRDVQLRLVRLSKQRPGVS